MEAKIHRRPHHPRVLTEEAFSWSETAAPMSWIPIYDNGLGSIRFLDRTDNSCQHDSTSALAVPKMMMTFVEMFSGGCKRLRTPRSPLDTITSQASDSQLRYGWSIVDRQYPFHNAVIVSAPYRVRIHEFICWHANRFIIRGVIASDTCPPAGGVRSCLLYG